ncbi:MAG: hypothetical protein KKG09_07235 [Verrucomicrobia bacterium]|nr:hypothetical protein [Verrucomicrobiota bacterium]MCG2681256.1 non-lysosomal glucosylceramidase [Kiritimatiellia bacterium]MBU4246924.1 hypothetical protein [Verrucomicrobiota bacterium]MBU4291592.1 hypothetical protein [Verrucomicrobiota bacterium]MBU4428311.1 hypothetical protein [Verrucomicrobiota bacterium]
MRNKLREEWPVLISYDQNHLMRIAMPLGGIGTGTVSLGGRGDLRDWEIANRPAKGWIPGGHGIRGAFFAIYAKPAGSPAATRALMGPVETADYEGESGSGVTNHGLPRFSKCTFEAAYPLGQVHLSDPAMPVAVTLQAFNPLVPADADASGIPAAILRYVVTNRTYKTVMASICGTIPNFIGADGTHNMSEGNVNAYRKGAGVRGLWMSSSVKDQTTPAWGTMALTTTAQCKITHRTAWLSARFGTSSLDFWDDFSGDGKLEPWPSAPGQQFPVGSLAVEIKLPPKATKEVTFLMTWHFPNRYNWFPRTKENCCGEGRTCMEPADWIGNYYCRQFADAWAVAEKVAADLPRLEADTVKFVQAFCSTNLPAEVKDAALANLSTLRTQTCFRTPDGRLFGWEGCGDKCGCCQGSCTHVWNYENTVAFLFGGLSMSMRDVEFAYATRENGHMSCRVMLPLKDRAQESFHAAADGQMGCIVKMYRDWQLSGDTVTLQRLWPFVKKALAFCWVPGGWDGDRDGVMEGCQHNTMDVEYYGPNGQMGIWYLAALRSGEEMAKAMGDTEFAATCRDLFERGSKWIDENLFNGEFYEHKVQPPAGEVAPGLREGTWAPGEPKNPEYQLGAACLVDQLVGQYLAHVAGLGHLVKPENVAKTYKAIMKYNYRKEFNSHFSCYRSFVLGNEEALLMAAYPKDRPKNPFPYFTEVMTGFEYAAAIGMLQEGQTAAGLKCIRNIRERYDGRKRNPFDEAECGHHYARAMASWAATLALTGFQYSGVAKSMKFTPKDGVHFWSNGYAWGTCKQRSRKNGVEVQMKVLHGALELKSFVLGMAKKEFATSVTIKAGKTAFWHLWKPTN